MALFLKILPIPLLLLGLGLPAVAISWVPALPMLTFIPLWLGILLGFILLFSRPRIGRTILLACSLAWMLLSIYNFEWVLSFTRTALWFVCLIPIGLAAAITTLSGIQIVQSERG